MVLQLQTSTYLAASSAPAVSYLYKTLKRGKEEEFRWMKQILTLIVLGEVC